MEDNSKIWRLQPPAVGETAMRRPGNRCRGEPLWERREENQNQVGKSIIRPYNAFIFLFPAIISRENASFVAWQGRSQVPPCPSRPWEVMGGN